MQSFASAAVGYVVFSYMNQADVGYLDVSASDHTNIICVTDWPEIRSYYDLDSLTQGWEFRSASSNWVTDNQCGELTTRSSGRGDPTNEKCNKAEIPMTDLNRKLAVPLSLENGGLWDWRNDAIEFYGLLFLLVSLILWVSLLFHDLALLSIGKKNGIYDFITIRTHFQSWTYVYNVFGFRIFRRLLRGRGIKVGNENYLTKQSKLFLVVTAPMWIVWWVATFMLVIVPWAMFLCIRHPVKLSRCVLFLNCLACGLYGTALTIHSMVFVMGPRFRPKFAVTWMSPVHVDACTCGCSFPISSTHSLTLMGIGILVAYKSFILAFRCLKGLRQSNWSNLLSVMFPVPLTVYEVLWTTPGGEPILHRKEGDPVQGELAFDPFALMDEQPNSCKTTLHLMPSLLQASMSEWTLDMVTDFLFDLELGKYAEAFQDCEIDGRRLVQAFGDKHILEDAKMESADQQKLLRAMNQMYTVHVTPMSTSATAAAASGGARSQQSAASFRRAGSFTSGKSSLSARVHAGPKRGESGSSAREYIGCCGFPCRSRSRRSYCEVGTGHKEPSSYLNTEAIESDERSSPEAATVGKADTADTAASDAEAGQTQPKVVVIEEDREEV